MKTKLIGFIIAIAGAILYGLMPLLAKTVYASGSNSFTLVFLRMCIGTAAFYVLHRITSKSSIAVTGQEFKRLCLCAVGYGFTPVLLYTSYYYMASGLATTLHFVYPVFVVIGCVLCRTAKLTKRKLICCLLCMAGIISFYSPGEQISVQGILIALASGMVYAFYGVYLEASGLFRMEACKLAFWIHLLAVVISGGCMVIGRRTAWPGSVSGWTIMLLLGLLAAAASFSYQLGTRFAGAQNTALLSTFEPLTSIIVGYFVYAEQLTAKSIFGIVCILLSVILLSLDVKEK